MNSVFEPGLVDRLESQWGPHGVDVHMIAKNAVDMVKRKRVRNPNALLVHMVRDKAAKLAPTSTTQQAAASGLQLRYAAYMAELMRRISKDGLRPVDVAATMRVGVASGFPKLNPILIDILEAMGGEWKRVG